MRVQRLQTLIIGVLLTMAAATSYSESDANWREDFAYMMGKQAYIYGFPAMNNSRIRYSWIEGKAKDSAFGSQGNVFTHYRQLVDPSYQYGTSMNRDTLYSIALSYLGNGPLVFTFPKNPDGRYFSIQLTEWYTDTVGYMSRRTVGNKAAAYLVHFGEWEGEMPEGIDAVLESPTPWMSVVGRTYTSNTPEDLEIVYKIQGGYRIYPLSEWGKDNPRQAEPITDVLDIFSPGDPLATMKILDAAMRENPPPARDEALMKQFALVNIGPLATGSIDDLDEHSRRGLARAAIDAQVYLQKVSEEVGSITNQNKVVNGWKYNPNNWCRMAEFGDFLGRSATQSLSGGIENCVEEAVKLRVFTDENGEKLNGEKRYVLKFKKDQVPRVEAFWSITLYDNSFNLVQTSTEKFAVRDIDPDIKYGEDGSLTIYLQSEPPGEESVNWLPTPAGTDFNLFFRAYLPEQAFIDQSYEPPAVTRIN